MSNTTDFPNGGGLTMGKVTDLIGNASSTAASDVTDAMEILKKNTDDPAALIDVQMKIGIWSSITSTASSTYSTMKDMMSSIAQKI